MNNRLRREEKERVTNMGIVEDIDLAFGAVYRPKEAAVGVMVEGRAAMRAGQHHQRAVVDVAVVEIDAGRQHVVVGVWIECPVLVPFDRRAVARRLHVELAAVLADGRPQELRQDRRDRRIARQGMEEGVPLEDRGLQPADPRQGGAVAGLEVVELVIGGDAARLVDDAVGERAQLAELLALDQARDHQIAVSAIGLDLLFAEHAKP